MAAKPNQTHDHMAADDEKHHRMPDYVECLTTITAIGRLVGAWTFDMPGDV